MKFDAHSMIHPVFDEHLIMTDRKFKAILFCLGLLANLPFTISFAQQSALDASLTLINETERYRTQITELETASGPYAAELFEPLSGLAQALVEAENYTEAAAVIEQAIQVSRVNGGLYNMQQLPLLLLGLDLEVRTADFDAANNTSDYLLELYLNGYRDQPMALIQSLESVSDWHLSILSHDIERNRAMHLVKSHDINNRVVELASDLALPDTAILNRALYRQALSVYYFASAMAAGGYTGARVLTETGTHGLVQESESIARRYPREFKEKLDRSMGLIRRIVESYPETEPPTEAQVMASLYYADWLMLYRDGKQVVGESSPLNSPRRLYRQVREDLIALGHAAETVDQFFATPALIPVNEFSESFEKVLKLSQGVRTSPFFPATPEIAAENADLARLPDFIAWSESLFGITNPTYTASNLAAEFEEMHGDVRFRVDTSGKASRLRVLQHHPADKTQRQDLMREVQALVFRPALVNNRFRNSEFLTLRYFYALDYDHR